MAQNRFHKFTLNVVFILVRLFLFQLLRQPRKVYVNPHLPPGLQALHTALSDSSRETVKEVINEQVLGYRLGQEDFPYSVNPLLHSGVQNHNMQKEYLGNI